MDCWKILGIEKTRDPNEIVTAYTQCVQSLNPSNDPKQLTVLAAAYQEAMAEACSISGNEDLPEEKKYTDGMFEGDNASRIANELMTSLADLYSDTEKRFSLPVWKSLLTNPQILQEDVKNALIRPLFEFFIHYPFCPAGVWELLDSSFGFRERYEELLEHYEENLLASFYGRMNTASALYDITPIPSLNGSDLEQYYAKRDEIFLRLSAEAEIWGIFEDASELYGDDEVLDHLKGLYYKCKEDPAGALRSFEAALSRNPDMLSASLALGYAFLEDREYEKAFIVFEQAAKSPGNNSHTSGLIGKGLGISLFHTGREDKALELFDELQKQIPFDYTCRQYKHKIHSQRIARLGRGEGPEKALTLAESYFAMEDYENARMALTAQQDQLPARGWYLLAKICEVQDELNDAALPFYDRAFQACGGDEPLLFTLRSARGHLYSRLAAETGDEDRRDLAIADFMAAVVLSPRDPAPYGELADLFESKSEYKEALIYADKGVELNPADWQTRETRGYVFYAADQYEEAIADYDFVTDRNCYYPRAWHIKGDCYLELGDYARACECFREAESLGYEDEHFSQVFAEAKSKLAGTRGVRSFLGKLLRSGKSE